MTKSEINIQPAKRNKRIYAALIDTFLAVVLFAFLSTPLILIYINNLKTPGAVTSLSLSIISLLTGALVCLGALVYEIFLPFIWGGQSVGMRLMRIQIVDEKGELLKLSQLITRAITLVFIFITTAGISLLAELFIVLLGTDHRSFNDTVSRIYVVDYVKPTQKPTKGE